MTARILVVDDIPANVELMKARLEAEYFEVLTASDGYEALAACEKNSIDLVALDVKMPGMDGFEVCQRIRENPRTEQIPIILVTALDQIGDRIQGLRCGADDLLVKPVDDRQLVARVRNLLSRPPIGQVSYSSPKYKPSVLVVGRFSESLERGLIPPGLDPTFVDNVDDALASAAEGNFHIVIVHHSLNGYDPLRLCSQLRSLQRTRRVPLILLARSDDVETSVNAFNLGVNDCVFEPLQAEELDARVMNILRRAEKTGAEDFVGALHSSIAPATYRNSPVQFSVIDDKLVVQQRPPVVDSEDQANVAAARLTLRSDGSRLRENLLNSNVDPRLREVFDRQISIAVSGKNIIQLGLVNIESGAMLAAADRDNELLPTLAASLQSFCMKTDIYVGQFKEWRRFVENARTLPPLADELPKLTEIVEKLSVALQINKTDVDTDVPRSIDFVISVVRNPRGSTVAASLALVSLIENIAVVVAGYCADLLKGTAQIASKKLQTTLGVGVAVAVTSALTSYLDLATRLGLSPWIGPALSVLKRFIASVTV